MKKNEKNKKEGCRRLGFAAGVLVAACLGAGLGTILLEVPAFAEENQAATEENPVEASQLQAELGEVLSQELPFQEDECLIAEIGQNLVVACSAEGEIRKVWEGAVLMSGERSAQIQLQSIQEPLILGEKQMEEEGAAVGYRYGLYSLEEDQWLINPVHENLTALQCGLFLDYGAEGIGHFLYAADGTELAFEPSGSMQETEKYLLLGSHLYDLNGAVLAELPEGETLVFCLEQGVVCQSEDEDGCIRLTLYGADGSQRVIPLTLADGSPAKLPFYQETSFFASTLEYAVPAGANAMICRIGGVHYWMDENGFAWADPNELRQNNPELTIPQEQQGETLHVCMKREDGAAQLLQLRQGDTSFYYACDEAGVVFWSGSLEAEQMDWTEGWLAAEDEDELLVEQLLTGNVLKTGMQGLELERIASVSVQEAEEITLLQLYYETETGERQEYSWIFQGEELVDSLTPENNRGVYLLEDGGYVIWRECYLGTEAPISEEDFRNPEKWRLEQSFYHGDGTLIYEEPGSAVGYADDQLRILYREDALVVENAEGEQYLRICQPTAESSRKCFFKREEALV